VFAAGKQDRQDHQIRIREEQLFRFSACGFGSPGNETQMPASCKIPKMLEANASQAGDFIFGEELLARFDGDHAHAFLPVLR
jgi:hypothetical protein